MRARSREARQASLCSLSHRLLSCLEKKDRLLTSNRMMEGSNKSDLERGSTEKTTDTLTILDLSSRRLLNLLHAKINICLSVS